MKKIIYSILFFFCKKLGFFYLLYLSNYVHLYESGIELELHTPIVCLCVSFVWGWIGFTVSVTLLSQ